MAKGNLATISRKIKERTKNQEPDYSDTQPELPTIQPAQIHHQNGEGIGYGTIRVETWDPKKAAEQLKKNNNRSMAMGTVLRYAQDMSDGFWEYNGETIKISEAGWLQDGQKRLQAIILSQKTIRLATVRGLPDDGNVFNTIDTGQPRNGSHVLQRNSVINASTAAAAVNWIWKYKHGKCLERGAGSRPQRHQMFRFFDEYSGLEDSIAACTSIRDSLPAGVVTAAHYLFWKTSKDKPAADLFIEQLSAGQGLKSTDPVYKLREYVIASARRRERRNDRWKAELLAVAIKAWNATHAGGVVKRLAYNSLADKPEGFPVLAKK